jgi:hypothetical protein
MRVLVAGNNSWNNYMEFIRNMTLIIEDVNYYAPDEKQIVFVHTGRTAPENMTTEWIGKIEKYARQSGYSLKEELFRGDRLFMAYQLASSNLDYAILFIRGRKDSQTEVLLEALKENEVPFKLVNS